MSVHDVVLLDDELVDESCPMHADVELGDITALAPHERNWLENIACPELHEFYETARRRQLETRHETDPRKRFLARDQMSRAIGAVDRLRARMTRLIAGEPEPDPGPVLDLWG